MSLKCPAKGSGAYPLADSQGRGGGGEGCGIGPRSDLRILTSSWERNTGGIGHSPHQASGKGGELMSS